MIKIKFKISLLITITLICSCKKNIDIAEVTNKKDEIKIPENFFGISQVPGVAKNNNNESSIINAAPPLNGGIDANNGDDPIILGNQITNPYTVANMQNVVSILSGGNIQSLTATHKYVRFKPSTPEQLAELEDNQDLELQDYPMDYEVIQEGDYYQDPNLGIEEIGWLYSVVPADYTAPSGYNFEVLSELYLTDNSLLEDMAESLANGLSYDMVKNTNNTITITREDNDASLTMRPVTPCSVDPCQSHCPYDQDNPCYGNGGGGGTPPTVDGGIFVHEQDGCGIAIREIPVRQVRVVAKRWFKVWRGYTDNNGDFTVGKPFKNKISIIVKTKNNHAKISKIRGSRLWQMLFPLKVRVGVFNNNELPTVRYVFTKPTDGSAQNKELARWAAVTTHNSVLEFKEISAADGLTAPENKLHIMVSNWGFMRESGAAPMWSKGQDLTNAAAWLSTFVIAPSIATPAGVSVMAVLHILKHQTDIMIGYASNDYNCRLTTPALKSIVYHELGHAQHHAQAGEAFWDIYRIAIGANLVASGFADPYGGGQNPLLSPQLALGEMWGNHCEKWYSEKHYGGTTPRDIVSRLQGTVYNNTSVAGLNANFAAIERHNPNLVTDDLAWIPQGLPYDLWDNRNDNNIPLGMFDEVNGYTFNQSFNALQSNVRTLQQYRDRLLQQNGNAQQAQVNQLFQRYGF